MIKNTYSNTLYQLCVELDKSYGLYNSYKSYKKSMFAYTLSTDIIYFEWSKEQVYYIPFKYKNKRVELFIIG